MSIAIDDVMLRDPAGRELKAEWKTVKAGELELKLPLASGSAWLADTAGEAVADVCPLSPQPVQLQAFSAPGHLEGVYPSRGRQAGSILKSSGLNNVASLLIKGIEFVPGTLSSQEGSDELSMLAKDRQATVALKAGDIVKAKVSATRRARAEPHRFRGTAAPKRDAHWQECSVFPCG